jgi:undecaprenyl-diphosphatase
MQGMDVAIVKWIQSFRNDILDVFFLFITEFGDETVFLILAAILYWTFDKKFAYRFMMFFLAGAVINGALKFLTGIARPHEAYEDEIVLIGEGSSGTSLPSGHAQNSTMMALTLQEKKQRFGTWFQTFLIIMTMLVMLSRLYLGEHYLSDVLFGLAISYALYTFFNRRLDRGLKHPRVWKTLALVGLLGVAFLTEDKNVFVAGAAIVGVLIGYPLEQKLIGFRESGTLKTQILKLVIGLSVALLLRIVIKDLFELGLYSPEFETEPTLLDNTLDFARYFVIVLWMTLGAPFIFKKVLQR